MCVQKKVKPAITLTGNLTIKGITKSIGFIVDLTTTDDSITGLTPQFTIDRAEYDIKFKSKKFFDDLKDDFINNDITLGIRLNASKAI